MTRIQSAMMLRIDRPDLELRRKILQHRVAESGVELGEECVEFIAENMPDNVRQLEGAIRTLITRARFNDLGVVDLATTRSVVGETVSIDRPELTPHLILETVCRIYGQEVDQLRTSSPQGRACPPPTGSDVSSEEAYQRLLQGHRQSSSTAVTTPRSCTG